MLEDAGLLVHMWTAQCDTGDFCAFRLLSCVDCLKTASPEVGGHRSAKLRTVEEAETHVVSCRKNGSKMLHRNKDATRGSWPYY